MELFSICDVVIGDGKGELGVLTSSRLVQFYRHIIEDYDRLQFGYEAIRLVSKASETIDEPEWYDLLAELLMALDSTTIALELTQTWFYLRYATLLGHQLNLSIDVNGDRLDAEQTYRYDASEQGLLPWPNGSLTAEHIKLLRLVASRPLKILAQIGGLEAILSDCFQVAREHAAV